MSTTAQTRPHGHPTWNDLSTSDLAGATSFYSALFGWQLIDAGEEFGQYHNAFLADRRVAGMAPAMAEGQPPAWTVYFATPDCEATAKSVSEHGGTNLFGPMQVGDQGSMLTCMDPAGVVFGAWQAGAHTGSQVEEEPGSPCWHELMTHDVEAAATFYQDVFGYSYQPIPGMDYRTVHTDQSGENAVSGIGQLAATDPRPPAWGVYFLVEDTGATVTTAKALGGAVLVDAVDTPHGRMAIVTDPQGAVFSVIQSPEA